MHNLSIIIEAALLVAEQPLSLRRLTELFTEDFRPSESELQQALTELANHYQERGIMLQETVSGYSIVAKPEMNIWIKRLWQERPIRHSSALLETLALVAYRQPITRAEIEDVRGVAVSSGIIRTLLERKWVRVIGQREVPGRPSLYATTPQFLDDFNLKSLNDLPSLAELPAYLTQSDAETSVTQAAESPMHKLIEASSLAAHAIEQEETV